MAFPLKAYFENVERIYRKFFGLRKFVFNFDYYDGTETDNNKTISDQNVFEYEFINQGNSICLINGMKLYPKTAGIEPWRIKLDNRQREKDVQVYKYSFQPVDFIICNQFLGVQISGTEISAGFSGELDTITTGEIENNLPVAPNAVDLSSITVPNLFQFAGKIEGFNVAGGLCPVMVKADAPSKTCEGTIFVSAWFAPVFDCNITFEFFIDGVALNTPFVVNTITGTPASIQAQIIANIINFTVGSVTVTNVGGDMFILFEGVVLNGGAGVLSLQLSGICPILQVPDDTVMVCDLNIINSLLVISKVPADRVKTNQYRS